MLSGSKNSEWAFFDLNSESSHYWAQEVQLACDVTASHTFTIGTSTPTQQLTSDGVSPLYPTPTGGTAPWGGMKTYFLQTSSPCAASEVVTMSCDLDYRNRKIIIDEFLWYTDPYHMPCLSASEPAPGGEHGDTTYFYPLCCFPDDDPSVGVDWLSSHQPHSFWTGTGSLPNIPTVEDHPRIGTYLPVSGAIIDDALGFVYCDARSGYLCYFQQIMTPATYISVIFRVSDQYPTRDPVSALYHSHNSEDDIY